MKINQEEYERIDAHNAVSTYYGGSGMKMSRVQEPIVRLNNGMNELPNNSVVVVCSWGMIIESFFVENADDHYLAKDMAIDEFARRHHISKYWVNT